MSPLPRAAYDLDAALSQALEDLEAGLTPLQVLDRYPEYEAELSPLLETAYRLRMSRWPSLSMAARVAGREKIHEALAAERTRRRSILAPFWRQLGAGVALVLLAGTTYLASPLSPFRPTGGPTLTPTVSAMSTVYVAPTVTPTWTRAPSATARPPATALAVLTPLVSPTGVLRRTVDPTEESDTDRVLADTASPTASLTPRPTATATRAATATLRPTLTPTATPSPLAPPTDAAAATPASPASPVAPSPTTSPSHTPFATPAKPTRTPELSETPETPETPGATGTATSEPAATPSSTRPSGKPSNTPAATSTPLVAPSRTPETRDTPEPTETPRVTNIKNSAVGPIVRELLRAGKANPGQELRAAIEEWRRAERARQRPARP